MLQGLYEYVKPTWQKRARPDVSEFDVTKFGSTSPPRPKDPQTNSPISSGNDAKGVVSLPRYDNYLKQL